MKEEYIKIRNSRQYDVTWFYKYFMENGGRHVDINQFAQAINFINIENMLDFLDHKFNLTVVYRSNGEFVRVV